jgi:NAD(P)-dependent dehydrogenase (short-subunit alcohol dehydrogenase family)
MRFSLLETSADGEERPLKKCDISELVINVAGISPCGFIAAVLSTNPEAKHFPSISLISMAVIVISIRESHSWKVSGKTLARFPSVFSVALFDLQGKMKTEMRLKGKTALITGGNSGIGLATARLFIAEGAAVAITGRNQATLDAALAELGGNALAMQADVADLPEMEKVIAAVVERFGKIDIVFANAGIGSYTPLGTASVDTFEQIMRVNVTSIFFLVQACMPYLPDGASIILNSSVQSVNGRPGLSAYAASKAAVRTMARVMASELSSRSIRVNVVTPGSVDTPMWNAVGNYDERRLFFDKLKKTIPLGRMGDPMEVANAVLFLATDESSFIQGGEIVVDGGATTAPLGARIYQEGL